MTKHAATLALSQALLEPPGSLPEGHLELINARQQQRGKASLAAGDIIVRPIRLTGDRLSCLYTRFPQVELEGMAQQVRDNFIPLLSGHVTDDRPIGTLYTAQVTREGDTLWLDTYAYWLSDEAGLKLARDIDAGIINEASIGWLFSSAICSVYNGDFYDCGHWPGETYPVTNPQTQVTEERLCFIWVFDCTIQEVPLCFGVVIRRHKSAVF
jgi:hypothetical protein